jgi:tetratricopeptide (TPR) repeat protein
MERLKEWHKSADVYQEILEKYQDRVIPVATNDKGQFIKYSSVTVAVQERLARWPEDGLTVYRARYEPSAAMMLEQARSGDYRALHDILSRYFVTEAAKQAGFRLMDLYLESGEFMAATWIGQRLLEWHPNLAAEKPRVLFRTAIALHLAGQTAEAANLFDELKAKYPNEVATIAGKDTSLVDALARQLEQRAPVAAGRADDSWPMFGGDEARCAGCAQPSQSTRDGGERDAGGGPGAVVFPGRVSSLRGATGERCAAAGVGADL